MVWLMIPQYLPAAGKFSLARVSSAWGEQACDGVLFLIVFGGALVEENQGICKRIRQLSSDVSGEKRRYFFLAGIRIRFSDFDKFLHIPRIEHDYTEPIETFRSLRAEPAG